MQPNVGVYTEDDHQSLRPTSLQEQKDFVLKKVLTGNLSLSIRSLAMFRKLKYVVFADCELYTDMMWAMCAKLTHDALIASDQHLKYVFVYNPTTVDISSKIQEVLRM